MGSVNAVTDANAAVGLEQLGDGEMAQRIRAFDWTATPLGPVSGWSPRLLSALNSALSSRSQFVIYWGPELICLYNDAEIPTLGDWHPRALGVPASTLLATMWDVVGPQLHSVLGGGPSTWSEDEPLLFDRNGQVEEAFFTYSYSPIRDDAGRIEGVLLSTHETTQRVIGERHLRTLQLVAAQAASAPSAETVCAAAAEALVTNPDFPFAHVYLIDGRDLRRAGSSGGAVPGTDGGAAPPGWRLLEVAAGGLPEVVDVAPGDDRLPRRAIAVPIADAGARPPAGVLVVGVADVRPINDRKLGFLELVAGQIGAALTGRRALALTAATAEREQIERDLHDSVQQQLLAAGTLTRLAQQLLVSEPEKARLMLEAVDQDIDVALMQLRDIVQGIYPALLRAEGLVPALQGVCRRSPVDARVVDGGIGRFGEAIESAVYYVCMEALQNTAKHGGPGVSADVYLEQGSAALSVRIVDTGPGFDRSRVAHGAGLENMEHRIGIVGGSFGIASGPDGTTVSASVPLE